MATTGAPEIRIEQTRGDVPPWVSRSVGPHASVICSSTGFILQRFSGATFTLLRADTVIEPTLPDGQFRAAALNAYLKILGALQGLHPVRFWNFLPAIHRSSGNHGDRYQLFNSGRFAAFEQFYVAPDSFPAVVATASAVGHNAATLTVSCLAMEQAGGPVDNPMQIRPYDYSRQFGSQPPCFARGTLIRSVRGKSTLLAGGTASIVGETSMCRGDLIAQTQQTLDNLSTLVHSAAIGGGNPELPLASFKELRVYHRHAGDAKRIDAVLRNQFCAVADIEFVRADICRRELLVEIEGIAGEPL